MIDSQESKYIYTYDRSDNSIYRYASAVFRLLRNNPNCTWAECGVYVNGNFETPIITGNIHSEEKIIFEGDDIPLDILNEYILAIELSK